MIFLWTLDHETHVRFFNGADKLNYCRIAIEFTNRWRDPPSPWLIPNCYVVGFVAVDPGDRYRELGPFPRRVMYLCANREGDGTTEPVDESTTICDPLTIVAGSPFTQRPKAHGMTFVQHRKIEASLHHARARWINHAREFGYSLDEYSPEKFPRVFGLNL